MCCHASPVNVATNSSDLAGPYTAFDPASAPSIVKIPLDTVTEPPGDQLPLDQPAGSDVGEKSRWKIGETTSLRLTVRVPPPTFNSLMSGWRLVPIVAAFAATTFPSTEKTTSIGFHSMR